MIGALRYSTARVVAAGQWLSSISFLMEVFVMGWLAVDIAARDGTPQLGPLYVGLVALGRAVPGIALTVYGGIVIDRVDRRSVVLWSNGAALAIAAAFAVLAAVGAVNIVVLVVFASLYSAASAFEHTARQAIMFTSVPAANAIGASAVYSVIWQSSFLIGPLLGGLLIVPFGVSGVFAGRALLHAGSHVVSLSLPPLPPDRHVARTSALSSLVEGLHFIRHEAVLGWVVVALIVIAVDLRAVTNLIPAVTRDILHVGAVELSWMMSVAAVGSLAAALLTGAMSRVPRPGLAFIAALLACGLASCLLAVQVTFAAGVIAFALQFFFLMSTQTLANGLIAMRTPHRLMGRVLSVNNLNYSGVAQLGTLGLGAVAAFTNLSGALFGAGVVGAVFAFVLLLVARPLRERFGADAERHPVH